jgi:hypothetical protein
MPRTTAQVAKWVANKRKGEPYDDYVGRPSAFGNPFRAGRDGTREEAVKKFEEHLLNDPELLTRVRKELQGKVLGCYCAPLLCHSHVLAWYANIERD